MNRGSMAFALVLVAVFLSGCLKTRSDVRESEQRQELQQQVVTLQRGTVDAGSRVEEVNEDLRDLRGRVEVLENRQRVGQTENEGSRKALVEQNSDLNRRVTLLQETITKMDFQMQAMTAELAALKAELAAALARQATAPAPSAAAVAKDPFEAGMLFFNQKDWKKAILSFQKLRESQPKSKNVPEATYLIGVSFQELGLKDEAKTFYDEVVTKFPKSKEANKAKTRLKSLKK